MLGRNPLRADFNQSRLLDNNNNNNHQLRNGLAIAVACLIFATGCSRLGNSGPLTQRRIPFPPQPLRSNPASATQATVEPTATSDKAASAAQGQRAADRFELAGQERTESNPARDQIQNLKARPPKLSDLPRTTLYAEPTFAKVEQATFEQTVAEPGTSVRSSGDFNPAAEPPAQIFSQPLTAIAESLPSSPNGPAPFISSGKSTASADPSTALTTNAQSSPTVDLPNESESVQNDQLRKLSQRILLVTDQSSIADTQSTGAEANAADSIKDVLLPITKKTVAPQVVATKTFESPPTPLLPVVPKTIEKTATEVAREIASSTPIVDPNLQGEVLARAAPQKAQNPSEQPKQTAVKDAVPELTLPELTQPELSLPILERTAKDFNPVGQQEIASASLIETIPEAVAAAARVASAIDVDQIERITIDPTLQAQRDRRLNFSVPLKPKTVQPEPARVVYQKKKAPFLITPTVSKTLPEVADTRIASLKQPDFIAAMNSAPVTEPVKKCVTCENPDCRGCNIPSEDLFSQSAPVIRNRRSLAPMVVQPEGGDEVLEKKNFGQVSFSSADLPLPETFLNDGHNIGASFEQQIHPPAPNENAAAGETQSDVPPVGVEAIMKLNAVTWRSRLQQTIGLVEKQLDSDINSQTRTSLEINLRLLDVLSRQMEDIAQEQRSFTPSENQFWQHQLEAITSMLQTSELENGRDHDLLQHHTAHETLVHLRQAIAELESLANLKIAAGVFCTEVSGYGQFESFSTDVFEPGQKVLIYCEVENYNSVEHTDGSGSKFHTRLRGSYAIYDASGHAVQQAEFPVMEDVARRRRRDFYIHLPITIGDLPEGGYELHLLVEDLGGNKTASLTPPLTFSIRAGGSANLQARVNREASTR